VIAAEVSDSLGINARPVFEVIENGRISAGGFQQLDEQLAGRSDPGAVDAFDDVLEPRGAAEAVAQVPEAGPSQNWRSGGEGTKLRTSISTSTQPATVHSGWSTLISSRSDQIDPWVPSPGVSCVGVVGLAMRLAALPRSAGGPASRMPRRAGGAP
jgi:hypothetical protein